MIQAMKFSALCLMLVQSSFGFQLTPKSHVNYSREFSTNKNVVSFYKGTQHHVKEYRGITSVSAQSSDSDSGTNPFFNFLGGLNMQGNTKGSLAVETEEEKKIRLELEKRAELALAEERRQERVKEDALPYLFLFGLQFLPLVGTDKIESVIYFLGVAITTVYLGGRQETIDEAERISQQNALAAPIGASVALASVYFLLKFGIDPTTLYAIAVSLFGALAISDVGVPILRNVLPASFAQKEVEVPPKIAEKLELDPPTLPLDGLVTLSLGLLCTAIYWAPVGMEQKFIISNSE